MVFHKKKNSEDAAFGAKKRVRVGWVMDGGKDNWTSLVSTFLIRQEEVLLDWPRCVLSPSTIEIFYVPDDILLRIIPISWNSCKVLSLHPDQLTTSNTRLPGQSISTVGQAGGCVGISKSPDAAVARVRHIHAKERRATVGSLTANERLAIATLLIARERSVV